MSTQKEETFTSEFFAAQAIEIGEIFQRAVNDALRVHKRMGNPIATWKDGQVVIVPPEDILIPADESEPER